MSFEQAIKKITKTLDGKLNVNKEKVYFADGSIDPLETYIITLEYQGFTINVKNTIGYQASGKVTCLIDNTIPIDDFEINTISHFINLFLRKENRFKVKCSDVHFKTYLKKKALKELEFISSETSFDPYIFIKKQGDKNLITTEYHLAFKNSPNAIEPIFKFYQKLIDYLLLKSS